MKRYEIKKVKKQETEKRIYKIKDYVVYPKHGVGQITEFKKINIGGIDVETYILKFEKDKADGMVPVNKQSHLRPLATINQVNKCVSILKGKPRIKRSMWSRRAQEYEAKISAALKEATHLREEFRVEGRDEERRILHETREDVARMIGEARQEIHDAEQEAEKNLEREVDAFAKELMNKIVHRKGQAS